MSIKIKKISKDSTIYSELPNLNTGLDPLLELSKYSRILLQFNDIDIDNSHRYILNLNIGDMMNMKDVYQIAVYAMTSEWDENIGMFEYDPPIETGVNWTHRTSNDMWITEGGDYNNITEIIFTISDILTDDNRLELDISSIIYNMNVNNGIIIKFYDESIIEDESKIQMYSSNTHTIYEPKLFDLYHNQLYSNRCDTNKILSESFVVNSINSKDVYNKGSITRVRYKARPIYLEHTYAEINDYNESYYLPNESYYSIIDVTTNKVIIPFYDENVLNCDAYGNYFILNTNDFINGRYYKIILKVVQGELTHIIDNNYIFRIQ